MPSAVETWMDFLFGFRGGGVKLHSIALHPLNRPCVSRQSNVGDHREHRIGQILDHQGHPVRLGPAEAQERSGLGFAGLQCHPGPTEVPAQPDKMPVMSAFIQKQWLPS